MSILITGGAGFIGRHTAKLLRDQGVDIVILDRLSTHRGQSAVCAESVRGDIADVTLVRRVLRQHRVTAVIHLAASAHVGDSMARPDEYYDNNVVGTMRLLEAMIAENVKQLVFASTCSVYGHSPSTEAHEEDAIQPVSPYGESKLVIERALPWYERAYGLRWVALRYFNVAGAEDGLGEDLESSRRIIPRSIHAAVGEGPALAIFGTDFATPDGSAVRDYVHVSDVARANLLALGYLEQGRPPAVMNIAAGTGVSVLQIVESVGRQTGQAVPYRIDAARAGDPAFAVADISRAAALLGWTPQASGLDNIVSSVLYSCRVRAEALAL